MNGRQAKKLRQLARRQENKQLIAMYDDVQRSLKELVKPSPRWIPVKLVEGGSEDIFEYLNPY